MIEAKVAIAQSQMEIAVNKAIEAFEYGKQHHHKLDALDAALIVLQYHSAKEAELSHYREYMQSHATIRWRDRNADTLDKVLN